MRTRFSLVFREKLTVAVAFGLPPAPSKKIPLLARNALGLGGLLGVRQGLTDPKPRSVPTPPHRRCSQPQAVLYDSL
jgi:hypothetical protein